MRDNELVNKITNLTIAPMMTVQVLAAYCRRTCWNAETRDVTVSGKSFTPGTYVQH